MRWRTNLPNGLLNLSTLNLSTLNLSTQQTAMLPGPINGAPSTGFGMDQTLLRAAGGGVELAGDPARLEGSVTRFDRLPHGEGHLLGILSVRDAGVE